VALVCGAGEVGEAIAGSLGSAGAEVAVADTNAARPTPGAEPTDTDTGVDRLNRIEARLGATTFDTDLADPVQIGELFVSLRERFGRLDVLVCTEGQRRDPRRLLDISFSDYRATVARAQDATFLCLQKAAQIMAAGEGGRVIITTSLNVLESRRGAVAQEVAQSALRGLVKSAAVDLIPERITVNAILAGPLRSDVPADRYGSVGQGALNPAALIGDPSDIARAALWLADPENTFTTGTFLTTDGGQSALLP
jgi:NAD(P)-dependent dehydrogenase (short-subunit alcohol dehydrogenase family)